MSIIYPLSRKSAALHAVDVKAGYYLTGEEFILHPDRWVNWRIDPGIYRLTITVIWEGKPFRYEEELTVPARE